MDVATLRRAMAPTSVSDSTLATYLPHYIEAMRAAEITTVRRAAAFDSQLGHESAGLRYMAEIKTGDPDWSWDRTRYRGRGPIQLTWQSNYRKFGQWCKATGYVTDSELFVNQPELVEQPKWGFLAASWYWLNGGPRPGQINGFADQGDILAVSRCVNGWIDGQLPNGWNDNDNSRLPRWNQCLAIGDALLAGGNPVPDNRPDFNEFPFFLSGNSEDRNVADVDLWLMHTQEPPKGSDNRNDAALELRNFLESTKGTKNPVSYHYTGSMANDGGTTVVDCVDTDEAAWAVGNSNDRSINFCFAGTRSDWTRQQWLDNERGTIAAAAYLFVQDCAKYPKLKARVIAPNYSAPPGAADHNYCTAYLKDGNNHTDVGPNFPWDVFAADVAKYANETPVDPKPPTVKQFPKDYTDRELLEYMAEQIGPGLDAWGEDGDLGHNDNGERRTLRAGQAALIRKAGA